MFFKRPCEEIKNFMDEYKEFVENSLSKTERSDIIFIQGSWKVDKDYKDIRNGELFKNIMDCFKHIPGVPFDILAFRNGKMTIEKGEKEKSFFSASLIKELADEYGEAKDTNTIYINKGAKIIPLPAIDEKYGSADIEIILLTKNIKKLSTNEYTYR